jgi:hypothetical protein
MEYFLTLLELLENPDRWFRTRSLNHLSRFMNGYSSGQHIVGINTKEWGELYLKLEVAVCVAADFNGTPFEYFYQFAYDDDGAWESLRVAMQRFVIDQGVVAHQITEKAGMVNKAIFEDMMSGMLKQPGFNLGSPSISKLVHFLNGVIFAIQRNTDDYSIEQHFADFEKWLNIEKHSPTVMKWDRLFLARSGFNEEYAFCLFCDSYREFLKE